MPTFENSSNINQLDSGMVMKTLLSTGGAAQPILYPNNVELVGDLENGFKEIAAYADYQYDDKYISIFSLLSNPTSGTMNTDPFPINLDTIAIWRDSATYERAGFTIYQQPKIPFLAAELMPIKLPTLDVFFIDVAQANHLFVDKDEWALGEGLYLMAHASLQKRY